MRLGESTDFYRLLLEIEDPAILERYVRTKLGSVLDYDRKHGSSLADTMFLYLKYWGNIQKIASESYCHRNTVANRIRVLQEQLGFALDDPTERFELMTAFMIKDFNKLQKRT